MPTLGFVMILSPMSGMNPPETQLTAPWEYLNAETPTVNPFGFHGSTGTDGPTPAGLGFGSVILTSGV
jgi:hypothetical protein